MIWNPFNSEQKPKSVYDNITEGLKPEDAKKVQKGLRRTYVEMATSPFFVLKHKLSQVKNYFFATSNNESRVAPSKTLIGKTADTVLYTAANKQAMKDARVTIIDRASSVALDIRNSVVSPEKVMITPVDRKLSEYNSSKPAQSQESQKKATSMRARLGNAVKAYLPPYNKGVSKDSKDQER